MDHFEEASILFADLVDFTHGDNYLVASGVPIPRDDHAQALAELGLEMCSYVNSFSGKMGIPLKFGSGSILGH